jgi:hypothetical protein
MNPWYAKWTSKEEAWAAIATGMQNVTRGHTHVATDKKGKTKQLDISVHSDGPGIMMFYRRTQDKVAKGQKIESQKSGQAGMTTEQEAAEADMVTSIKELEKASKLVGDAKKELKAQMKQTKDADIPDAVYKAAMEQKGPLQDTMFKELQRRKRKMEQEMDIMQKVGRAYVPTETQQKEAAAFAAIAQDRRARGLATESDTEPKPPKMAQTFHQIGSVLMELTAGLKGATATPSKGGTVSDVAAKLKQLRADVASGVLDITPEEEKEMRRVILEGYVSR